MGSTISVDLRLAGVKVMQTGRRELGETMPHPEQRSSTIKLSMPKLFLIRQVAHEKL
jgi:hypothetical protein